MELQFVFLSVLELLANGKYQIWVQMFKTKRFSINRLFPLTKQHSDWLDLIQMQSLELGGHCIYHHGNKPYQQAPLSSFVICQLTSILWEALTHHPRTKAVQERTRGGPQQGVIYRSSQDCFYSFLTGSTACCCLTFGKFAGQNREVSVDLTGKIIHPSVVGKQKAKRQMPGKA